MEYRRREFRLLNMTGRPLNGIGKRYNEVDLQPFQKEKLRKILNGLSLLDNPENQLAFSASEFFSGMTNEEVCELRIRKNIQLFYELIRLIMTNNIPHLRFKILIDRKLPLNLLVDLLKNDGMDLKLEVLQIHFLDEIAQIGSTIESDDGCSNYSILRDVTFKTEIEMVVRPFESMWVAKC
ncbi:MAG: hypothetical protein PHR47_03710 [Candidatus Pacebacteria bacterium]|nr:hypothetical protein [Candidatus Paceibacterota bacterium]